MDELDDMPDLSEFEPIPSPRKGGRPRGSKSKAAAAPSRLTNTAREILTRTAAARVEIEAAIAGVEVEGGPPEVGPPRDKARRNRIRT